MLNPKRLDRGRKLRLLRILWVSFVNGCIVLGLLAFFPVREWEPPHKIFVGLLVAGVLFEILHFRIAKYFNIGTFLGLGAWVVLAYLFSLKELFGFFGPDEILPYIGVFALPAFIVAAVNYLLYRVGKRSSEVTASSTT